MSRYWDDPEEIDARIARGLIVQEYGAEDVGIFDYIAAAKTGRHA
jgi:hypothetical protein